MKAKHKDSTDEWPPIPREVEILRDSQFGFGFVAGSEKPVIVRFVKEGGPSEQKLEAGDQILKINGEDVMRSPREHVIDRVKSCKYSIHLTVCQPHSNNSIRKSAFLTAAKKAKLKSNPSKVRFAEEVVMNCSPLFSSSSYDELCLPLIPNLLKVFLENGQTKTFKYDSCTTVQDVLNSLTEKLSIKFGEYFGLVFENLKSTRRSRFTLLDPNDTLAKIAGLPGAHNLRCLLRVMFAPTDVYDILHTDSNSFEYLYHQCCNDVVMERFSPQLKYEIALRLSALQLNEYAISNSMLNSGAKVDLKAIERECGFDPFVPYSLLETMKRKELHKLLNHFLKLNQHLCASGQKCLTATQIKLNYLKIVCELPSYGSKMFYNNVKSSTIESGILVSPKYGISFIDSMRNCLPIILAKIEDIRSIKVTKDEELYCCIEVQLENMNNISIHHSFESPLHFLLEDRDAEEFVLILRGYHKILNNYGDNNCKDLSVIWDISQKWLNECGSSFCSAHTYQESKWNDNSEVLRQIGASYTHCGNHCDSNQLDSYRNVKNIGNNFEHNSNGNMNEENLDMPSVLSMEILESQVYDENIKSEDIVKRINEMNKIIADAEHYLAKQMEQPEPVCDYNGGLECANSLLLLPSSVNARQLPKPSSDSDSDSFTSNFDSPVHCFECFTNSKQLSNPSPHSYASPSSRSGSIGSSLITSSDDTCASHKRNTDYDSARVTSLLGNQYDTLSESSVTDNENLALNVMPIDIDNFIASMTIPPPPSVSPNVTDDDAEYLLSYIIPPPPSESPIIAKTQEDAIAKFWKVNDDIKKICDTNNSRTQLFKREVCSSNSVESGYDSALSMSTFPSPNDEWTVFSEPNNPKLPLSTVIEVVSSEFDHFNKNAFFLVKVSLT